MIKKKSKVKNRSDIYFKTFLYGIVFSILSAPIFTYAATTYSQDLFGLFEYAKDIIDEIVLWTITTLAITYFIYKLATYILNPGDKDKARFIIYGIIALTVMFTFYAISGLLAVTLGIQIGIPQFFKEQSTLSPGSGNVNKSYSVIGR